MTQLEALAPFNIHSVEQPLPADRIEDLAWLRQRSPMPIMVDESVWGPDDAARVIRASAADIINVYVSEAGGLRNAARVFAMAEHAGIACTIASMPELGIGTAAEMHLAVKRPGFQLCVHCRLRAAISAGLPVTLPAAGPGTLWSGPGATILDNCGAEVAFAAKNPKLCEEMSARVGYNTVDTVTRNRPRFWGAWQWRKQSVAAHPHSRAQLLPQEIFRMRHHQELIFRSGLVPVLADKIVYDQDPTFSLRGLPPPAVPEIQVAVPMDDGGMADPRLLAVGSTTR